MQTFFLFEQLAPKKPGDGHGEGDAQRGAHNKAEAVMPLTHPGQPLLAAIPPGIAGEDPWHRCDGTLGSSSIDKIPPRQPAIGLSGRAGVSVSLVALHLRASVCWPNDDGAQ